MFLRLFLIAFPALSFVVACDVKQSASQPADGNVPTEMRELWPNTDFSRRSVDLTEVQAGGPPRDGIPSIDDPRFEPAGASGLAGNVPVMSIEIKGDARAYPLTILLWHEIVNDVVGGVPVAVTFCPLCNSGLVFDRRLGGRVLEFGTSGMLRHSDLVMYDRQTESWWQQFTGEAIVGELNGAELKRIPVRLEAFSLFRERHPKGRVLIPNDPEARPYGRNPYSGYDQSNWPFLFKGDFDGPIQPLARVVAVGGEAWSLEHVRRAGTIRHKDLRIRWVKGQSSALDTRDVAKGRDVGTVIVERRVNGVWRVVPYEVPFAFAFRAFHPNGAIHTGDNSSEGE